MEQSVSEVYSLMIPIIEQSILLPNASVVEIVPFGDVEYISEGPSWFVGKVHWRTYTIPMVSIDILNGGHDPQANKRSRVAIVSTLNNDPDLPYLAIVVQGIPRLTHVTEPSVSMVDNAELGIADKALVKIGSIQAVIPDLDKLESLVGELPEF